MSEFRERELRLKAEGRCVSCKKLGGKERTCCEDKPSFCDPHYKAHLEITHGKKKQMNHNPRKDTYKLISERLLGSSSSGFGEFRKAGNSVDFVHDDGTVYRLSLKTIKTDPS